MTEHFDEINVEKLKFAPFNYKEDDEFMQGQLVANLRENGQLENIIVRELGDGSFEVVNGNHRLMAVHTLGWKSVIVKNLGTITDAQALKISAVTNETRFRTDQVKLAQALQKIREQFTIDDLKMTMPFTEDQLKNFEQVLKFDWQDKKLDDKPDTGEEGWRVISISLPESIAEQFYQQLDRFKKALHPEEQDLNRVSPVQSMEAMLQHLAQIPDEQLIG